LLDYILKKQENDWLANPNCSAADMTNEKVGSQVTLIFLLTTGSLPWFNHNVS
jgi:hypothetical protein